MNAPVSDQVYQPWRSAEYPRLEREITSLHWLMAEGLQIEVSEHYLEPACLRIRFPLVRAFQAIDEGYRLQDIAIGDALIYSSGSSRYLQAFRANAASTMDNFPLLHWFIISANQCMDAISENEPEVITLR